MLDEGLINKSYSYSQLSFFPFRTLFIVFSSNPAANVFHLNPFSDIRLATFLGDPQDGIGYINLSGFNSGAGRDFRQAMVMLRLVQHTVQYSTVEYSTVQYSTVQ